MKEEITVKTNGETIENKVKSVLLEIIIWTIVFVLTLVLFFTVKPYMATKTIRPGVVAKGIMAVSIIALLMLGIWWYIHKKLTQKRWIILLLLIGYILRVGYMLYTPAVTRQHDTFTKNFDGHEAYAWTLFISGKLPSHNVYQFYHPPLNAMVQAFFMRFTESLTQGLTAIFRLGEYYPEAFTYGKVDYIDSQRWFLYSSCQVLSVFYACVTCVTLLKILKLFSFSAKYSPLLISLLVFFPRLIQFSGMLNNDPLAFMFTVLAFFFTLKWQKQGKKLRNILFAGLCVGLGMMTKLSSATVCLPIAFIFIYEFVNALKKKENALSISKLLLQYALFLIVCAPIGLWFQIYAYQRFGQTFGYVFNGLNPMLYTGHHSFFSRFILCLDWTEYFGSIWCRPFVGNYYLFNYALRSAIFGEFAYWNGEGFAITAILLAYLSALLLAVAIGYVFLHAFLQRRKNKAQDKIVKTKGAGMDLWTIFFLMQSQVLSLVYFYIKMPYGCTMDFRYVMPMILAIALTVGFTQNRLDTIGTQTAIKLNRLLTLFIGGFLAVGVLFYCVCI